VELARGNRRFHHPARLLVQEAPPPQLLVFGELLCPARHSQAELDGLDRGQLRKAQLQGRLLIEDIERQEQASPSHGDGHGLRGSMAEQVRGEFAQAIDPEGTGGDKNPPSHERPVGLPAQGDGQDGSGREKKRRAVILEAGDSKENEDESEQCGDIVEDHVVVVLKKKR
jgi:hypothetical protein